MKVYLAGPIRNVADPISWRRKLATKMPEGWEVVDPTKIELFIDNEDSEEAIERLVKGDLDAIKSCDAVLALIDMPSWGTAMEIFYAHSLMIPIVAWNPTEKSVGPWLKFHCTIIVPRFEDIKLFLQNLLVKA
jgi:nucleoside 2-deoxyribosyltransferase